MPKPYNPQDKYYKKAKELGVRARSYFKLEEVDQKLRVFAPGQHILDLGAAPGSFIQYARKKIGNKGYILGIDLQRMDPLGGFPKVDLLEGDMFDEDVQKKVEEMHPQKFDVVMSDLAPKTSGNKDLDHWKSIELSEGVLAYAERFMKPKGVVIMKIFQGSDFDEFLRDMRKEYQTVKIVKPSATRDRSREVYLIGKGRKSTPV